MNNNKCIYSENGECVLCCEKCECNGTISEKWECAYCSDYKNAN